MTELILGTAQFGAGYGVTNRNGRISDLAMTEILALAARSGIVTLDTAPDYGDAQERLGEHAGNDEQRLFISKFGLPAEWVPADGAESFYASTLAQLRIKQLSGLIFHRVEDLRDPRVPFAWALLQEAREQGRVARIGASIYTTDDLELVAERLSDLDILQIPGNILDRRLLEHPLLGELRQTGTQVHVRSVYLQGLLLAAPEQLPDYFEALRPTLTILHDLASEQRCSVLSLCLAFLKNHPLVDGVLVGATTPAELLSTLDAWQQNLANVSMHVPHQLDSELLDPRRWPPRQPR